MQLSSQCLLILLSQLILRATASSASLANLTSSSDSTDARSTLNNTILGAFVPNSFTVQPSGPGARLGPNQGFAKTQVLFKVLRGLQILAVEDFDAETVPRSFDHPWFTLSIDGLILVPKSNILIKYAIW